MLRKSILVSALVALGFSLALAQISADALPSLENVGALIGGTDPGEVEEAVAGMQGGIAAGVPAGDAAYGDTAREIAGLLYEGDAEAARKLAEAFLDEREGVEAYIADRGFALNDLGVAYALAFVTFWELSLGEELDPSVGTEAAKFMVVTVQKAAGPLRRTPEEARAQAYDWLMTSPVAFAALVKAFEQNGRPEPAKQLRRKSAGLFEELFGLPPEVFTISEAGAVGVDTDKLLELKRTGKASNEVDALIDDILGTGQER
ncbi:hypothetical protein [Oceanithermus sp.]